MIALLFNCIIITLLNISAAGAQINPTDKLSFKDPLSVADVLMLQFDFNHDGQISEKEFIIGSGESGYRAHLSNIHQCLNLEKRENITKQQYWFVEVGDPMKYKQHITEYFAYMDKDQDEYISVKEYQNTFTGESDAKFGEQYAQIIDFNHDGKISRDEYINFEFTTLPSGDHEVFQNLDANKDTFISSDEFKNSFDKRW